MRCPDEGEPTDRSIMQSTGESKIMKRLTTLFLFLVMVSTLRAMEIKGVELPDTLVSGKDTLLLNGAGVRKKFFLNLYVGGLYLMEPSHDAQRIINEDEPMAIRLQITSKMVTPERMSKATEEGFVASTGGNTGPIQKEIDHFIALFKEGIHKGDVYDLVYDPGKGVACSKNGSLVTTVSGLAFKKALFGIWLCEKTTVNPDLKEAMLGN